MSEKRSEVYIYVWKLERDASDNYEHLTFFQKLKWGFNKKKYVEWFCENNKHKYPYMQVRR